MDKGGGAGYRLESYDSSLATEDTERTKGTKRTERTERIEGTVRTEGTEVGDIKQIENC